MNLGIKSNGKLGILIHNQLSPYDFFHIRGILALLGDLCLILKEVKKLRLKLDINNLYNKIKEYLPKFKDLREV
ncbi:MAG: hypothetical protein ACTSRH_18020 [Promethearchaeota archaeon]